LIYVVGVSLWSGRSATGSVRWLPWLGVDIGWCQSAERDCIVVACHQSADNWRHFLVFFTRYGSHPVTLTMSYNSETATQSPAANSGNVGRWSRYRSWQTATVLTDWLYERVLCSVVVDECETESTWPHVSVRCAVFCIACLSNILSVYQTSSFHCHVSVRQVRLASWGVMFSTCLFIFSSLARLVNTIVWKQMSHWCKLAQKVLGATTWSSQLWTSGG